MVSQPQTQMIISGCYTAEGRAVEDLCEFSQTNPQHTMTVDPAEQHDTVWISHMDFPIVMGYGCFSATLFFNHGLIFRSSNKVSGYF